jgi:hypothetical protein
LEFKTIPIRVFFPPDNPLSWKNLRDLPKKVLRLVGGWSDLEFSDFFFV